MNKTSGQTTIQLLLPLIILLIIAAAFAYVMPLLSNTQVLTLGGGIIFLIICLASTEIALYLLVFSMLLSPEIIVDTTAGASLGRGITLRVDDFIILIIGFSWLAKMAIIKEGGLRPLRNWRLVTVPWASGRPLQRFIIIPAGKDAGCIRPPMF